MNNTQNQITKAPTPKGGIDDYYLYIYPDVPDRCEKGFVGYIGNSKDLNLKIELEIDTEWMIEHNQISLVFTYDRNDPSKATLVMTARFFDTLRRTPCLEFGLWHEVGHYHTLRYFDYAADENGSTQKARAKYLEQGEVAPAEVAADIFALYYTSKDVAIEYLSESIRIRRTYTWEPPERTQIAIEEFRLRKRILRDLDTDEKARDALCKLCKIKSFYRI